MGHGPDRLHTRLDGENLHVVNDIVRMMVEAPVTKRWACGPHRTGGQHKVSTLIKERGDQEGLLSNNTLSECHVQG